MDTHYAKELPTAKEIISSLKRKLKDKRKGRQTVHLSGVQGFKSNAGMPVDEQQGNR